MTKDEQEEIKDIIVLTLVDENKTNTKEHLQLKNQLDKISDRLVKMGFTVKKTKRDVQEIIVDRATQTQKRKDWYYTREATCPKSDEIEVIKDQQGSTKTIKKYKLQLFVICISIITVIIAGLTLWFKFGRH